MANGNQTTDDLPPGLSATPPGQPADNGLPPGLSSTPPSGYQQIVPTYDPIQMAQGAAIGAGKSALGTVSGVADLLGKIPGIGPAIAPSPEARARMQQLIQPKDVTEQIGGGLEDLAEFYFGGEALGAAGEALKATELGDRLVHMAKVAAHYEQSSPFVKGLMDRGLRLVRDTGLGAALGGAKGAAQDEAGKGAAIGAATGAGLGVLGEAAGGVAKVARGLRGVPEPGLPPGPWIEDTVQADAHAGHGQIADNIAKDLGIQRRTLGDPTDPRSPTALRNVYDSLSDQVELQAKGKFKPLDDATDGEFTKLAKALKDNAVKMQRAVDPAVEARLDEEAAALRVRLDEATELAKQKGVDPKLADEGNALWRKKSALADVDAKMKIAMPGKEQAPKPTLNVDKLANSMQTLFDSRRLDDISPQRADDLLRQALESARQQELTRAAATSREQAISAAQKVREEAQKAVQRRRLYVGGAAATAVGGAFGTGMVRKGVEAVKQLTQ